MSTGRPAPRLPPRQVKVLVVAVLLAWLALGVVGYLIGHAVAPSGKGIIAGVVGALLASFVWVILCRIVAVVLRRKLDRAARTPADTMTP